MDDYDYNIKIIQIQMVLCLNCRRQSDLICELLCDHPMCLDCAQKLKISEGLPPLDAKFRICCPICKKNTTTLNIQNLVNHHDEKLLFANMESSELSEDQLEQPQHQEGIKNKLSESKLRKMSYTERRSNVYAERKTPEVTDRTSKASHDSQRNVPNKSRTGQHQNDNNSIYDVKCQIHKEPIMFYCEQENIVMCQQCMYKHMKQQKNNHQVCSIQVALGVISSYNKEFKAEAKRKIQDLDKCITICKGNKGRIEKAFEIHMQLIEHQFKELENLIRRKEEEAKEYLEKIFKKKQNGILSQVKDLTQMKVSYKQYVECALESPSSHVYFFNSYSNLRNVAFQLETDYKNYKKEENTAFFQKLTSIEDIAALLEKLFKPRTDGRQSKATHIRKQENNAPSRNSQKGGNTTKIKQHFYEETKKKLQKLNKLEDQHISKDFKAKDKKQDYLNNFFIEEVQKKNFDEKNLSGVPNQTYRKSSACDYSSMNIDKKIIQKALTPTRMTTANTKPKKK